MLQKVAGKAIARTKAATHSPVVRYPTNAKPTMYYSESRIKSTLHHFGSPILAKMILNGSLVF